MSILIGITGGIGSGKTTIANKLIEKGYLVFNSDVEAKKLLENDEVKKSIINIFGDDVAINGNIDRVNLAKVVFSNPQKLKMLNNIIHPKLKSVFEDWVDKHCNQKVLFKEAAILFETGYHKDLDYTILITAPKDDRIKRIIKRDSISKKQVLERMNRQWDDKKKVLLADFVINNTNFKKAQSELIKIVKKIENCQN